jgi:hypothetical protein
MPANALYILPLTSAPGSRFRRRQNYDILMDPFHGTVKSWFKFVRVSGVFLMGDLWSWLRRFAAERRRVREPERSREAAQLWRLSRRAS